MELIDREKLKSAACDYCCENLRKGLCARAYCSYLRIIDEQPTVDAVEVVRCRDCIYCEKAYLYSTAEVDKNDKCCTFNERLTNDDYFCPYGERSTE